MYHNSAQSYVRPASHIGVRQHFVRRDGWELPGGVLLWKAVGKVAAVVGLVVVLLSSVMGGYLQSLERKARIVENSRHELMDTNISLRAERAVLQAPDRIKLEAGKLLSLHVPADGQVNVYNRHKGRFKRL